MMMKAGDAIRWGASPALFTPGLEDDPPQWFALRCRPLLEERATLQLKDRGVTAFFPVVRRKVTVRGRPQERRQVFIPGYVFARFPGRPAWRFVLDRENPSRLIVDVIRRASGEPGLLREADLATIRAMVAAEEERLAEERRAREIAAQVARAPLRPGDLVRLPGMEGVEGEVVALTARGGHKVRLTLLGSTREVEVTGLLQRVLDGGGAVPEIAAQAEPSA